METQFKDGQRVRLVKASQEMLEKGIKPGTFGTVRIQTWDDGHEPSLGVEFDGYSNTGWNAGLSVVMINTRIAGKTFPIVDLCEALAPVDAPRTFVRKNCDHVWDCKATSSALVMTCTKCGRKTTRPYQELRQDRPIFPRIQEGNFNLETFDSD
jgi:hypothetical protein